MPEVKTEEVLSKLSKNLNDIITEYEPRIKELEEGLKGSAEDKQIVANLSKENAELVDKVKAAQEELTTRASEIKAVQEELAKQAKDAEDLKVALQKRLAQNGQQSAAFKTPGLSIYEQIKDASSEDAKALVNVRRNQHKSHLFQFPSWGLSKQHREVVPMITPAHLLAQTVATLEKTITNADASAGDMVDYMRVPGIVGPGERALLIRDLIPVGTTMSDVVRFVRESAVTDNAGPQTGSGGGQGDLKNESDFDFTAATANVETIAHFVVIALQLLDDAVGLQSYIDSRGRYLLLLEEEDQLLNGDGANNNLNGINTQATAYDSTLETTIGVSNTSNLDRIRVAMYQVIASEFPPTGVILNPLDWAGIEMTKDTQARYIFAMPQQIAMPRIWGLPVAVSLSQPAGEFTVGSFALGAQIWDRMSAAVAISTEDSDNFRRNLATMRFEERLALTVYRTLAFVNGPFTAASGS